jgi:hypothetical protein
MTGSALRGGRGGVSAVLMRPAISIRTPIAPTTDYLRAIGVCHSLVVAAHRPSRLHLWPSLEGGAAGSTLQPLAPPGPQQACWPSLEAWDGSLAAAAVTR